VRVIDEAAGEREFDLALEFIDRHQGAHGDRVRGILVPREIETCTVALMRKAAEVAQERDLPAAIHAAYNIHEVFDIIREHQMTSVELLRDVGLMSDKLNIGHGNFTCDNPADELSGSHDLEIMGSHHCSISHCPVNVARRGRFLDNWETYRKAGVNIALGTDTYPRDMILQMRNASYFGKVASRNLKAAHGRAGVRGGDARRARIRSAATTSAGSAPGAKADHRHHRPYRQRYASSRAGARPDQEPGGLRDRRRRRHGDRGRRVPRGEMAASPGIDSPSCGRRRRRPASGSGATGRTGTRMAAPRTR
jgi:cytosine/adenosine deaminase-related metal-dependent hydrolase